MFLIAIDHFDIQHFINVAIGIVQITEHQSLSWTALYTCWQFALRQIGIAAEITFVR